MLKTIAILSCMIISCNFCFCQMLPQFDTFKGKAYDLDFREVHKIYGDFIYDNPVITEIEWDKIDVSERFMDEAFPDIDRQRNFGIELHSTLKINQDACYEFILDSDDGSIFWIDKQKVVDNGGLHKMTEKRDTIFIKKGKYPVKLWYYQALPDKYGFIFQAHNVGQNCSKKLETPIEPPKPKREKITLKNEVYFDVNQHQVKEGAKLDLTKIGQEIRQKNPQKILIVGHTDNTGKAEYNLDLSLKRANAIKDYLAAQITLPHISYSIKGLGEKAPLHSNDSEEGRQKNRRVEIILTY